MDLFIKPSEFHLDQPLALFAVELVVRNTVQHEVAIAEDRPVDSTAALDEDIVLHADIQPNSHLHLPLDGGLDPVQNHWAIQNLGGEADAVLAHVDALFPLTDADGFHKRLSPVIGVDCERDLFARERFFNRGAAGSVDYTDIFLPDRHKFTARGLIAGTLGAADFFTAGVIYRIFFAAAGSFAHHGSRLGLNEDDVLDADIGFIALGILADWRDVTIFRRRDLDDVADWWIGWLAAGN